MKLYKVEIAGLEHVVQLTEEDAQAQGLKPLGEVEDLSVDLRAPSAKGETEDEFGRPLVESAKAENEARLARKAAAASGNKAKTAENK